MQSSLQPPGRSRARPRRPLLALRSGPALHPAPLSLGRPRHQLVLLTAARLSRGDTEQLRPRQAELFWVKEMA